MQDIDFDELDRAVSSVTTSKRSNNERSKATDSNSVAVNVGTSSTPSTSTPSPAARRSSGRFMDMVHPASDMRGKSEVPERPKATEPERSSIPERSEEPETPARSFEWPDPIDVPGTHSAPEPKEDEPAEASPSKPLESPFLNDTKVEKRPLGAFSDAAPALDTSLLVDEEVESEKEEAKAEELQTEALIQEAKVQEDKPVEQPAPTGPTSITQQYKEQPSTADQPSGAVFDTEEYHKPLAHPPKKRSSVAIILWIVALILVGGGAGAAIYFFVLPLL